MENELVIYDQKPLTAKDIRSQVNLIQEVMKSVMMDGTHYGKIPGCGDKPTLLKPGAEKLISTFNLCPRIIVEDLSKEDMVRYRIICRLETMSGKFVGDGVGECSSEESKYKWRKIISDEEYEATPEIDKRIKYNKGYSEKQVRTNPFDLANTILKMAKKRALVDATLTRTAASDIFTQDIEDMPEELFDKDKSKGKVKEVRQEEVQPPPASLTFEEYQNRMHTIKSIFELQNWWKKHGQEIKLLPAAEFNELVAYKDHLKSQFAEEKE